MRDNIQVFAKYIEDLAEAKEKSNLQKNGHNDIKIKMSNGNIFKNTLDHIKLKIAWYRYL